MNPLEDDQVGQSQGISIRIGHGLFERIKDYADSSTMSMSQVNRSLLEGAVDLLDEGVAHPSTPLPRKLDGIRKRIEITTIERSRKGRADKPSPSTPKVDQKVKALEEKMDLILEALNKQTG